MAFVFLCWHLILQCGVEMCTRTGAVLEIEIHPRYGYRTVKRIHRSVKPYGFTL